MPEYSFFIRSIRIRYLSGLLIFALASAVILVSLNRVNSFRHDVDVLSSNFVIFTRDLRNATSFAETTGTAWRTETRDGLAASARGHSERLTGEIETLTAQLAAIRPRLSAKHRQRTRFCIRERRPVLVAARHGPQPQPYVGGAEGR